MNTKYLGFFSFLCLAGCVTPLTREQQLHLYRARCLDYGYEPGTLNFAHCMKEQERFAEQRALEEEKLKALRENNKLKKREVEIREIAETSSKFKFNW